MIQRIQTIYLLISAVVSLGLIFAFSMWGQADQTVYAIDLLSEKNIVLKMVPILFMVSGALVLFSIFSFKNRKFQFVLNRVAILINLFLLGLLLYYLLSLPGGLESSEKGIGVFLPIVNVLLLVLANKAIQKDENLVKSVDRLR